MQVSDHTTINPGILAGHVFPRPIRPDDPDNRHRLNIWGQDWSYMSYPSEEVMGDLELMGDGERRIYDVFMGISVLWDTEPALDWEIPSCIRPLKS